MSGPDHASAARTSQQVIRIHLTQFAPGMDRVGLEDPKRWKTFWNQDLARVTRALLKRLQIAPAAIELSTVINGDVELLIEPPARLAAHLSTGDAPVPVAIFWEGADEAQLKAILRDLHVAGWTPPVLDIAA
ncbi:hypothetical protein [Phenylobacterium sp.]|uniref:hypothetical protein n=1 Tax=Phenylobacterium sp. TaxID=1871053 RepID=UPI002736F28A|nr:hypothetical protein [Phenylobacterium sp.]MDP3853173.1 hypothetical protein [Phenylobacterium sp.]